MKPGPESLFVPITATRYVRLAALEVVNSCCWAHGGKGRVARGRSQAVDRVDVRLVRGDDSDGVGINLGRVDKVKNEV